MRDRNIQIKILTIFQPMTVFICNICTREFVIQQVTKNQVMSIIPYFCPICGEENEVHNYD